jgi:predicted nucleic acid-binding protein
VESKLLLLWSQGACTLYTSEAQLEELRRVSRRRVAQRRIGRARFGALINLLRLRAVVLNPRSIPFVVPDDPHDDFIAAIALEARASLLVSDDRHITALKKIGKTTVQTPQQALPRLRKLVKR